MSWAVLARAGGALLQLPLRKQAAVSHKEEAEIFLSKLFDRSLAFPLFYKGMLRNVPELWKFCSHFSETHERITLTCFHLLLFCIFPLLYFFFFDPVQTFICLQLSVFDRHFTAVLDFPHEAVHIASNGISILLYHIITCRPENGSV